MIKARWLPTIVLMAFMPASYAGFYIGPGVVYQTMNISNDSDARYDDIAAKLTVGVSGTLPCPLSPLYAGLEGFYIPATVNLTNNPNYVSGTNFSLKTSYTLGAAVLAGFNLDKVLKPYARFGVLSTYFSSAKVNRSAYQVGLGIDAQWAANWGARGEYNYNSYQSISSYNPKQQELGISIFYLFL